MTKKQTEEALRQCILEKDQWVKIAYFLVSHFGENFKLVIHDVKHIQVPTLNNTLEWDYNRESDTLTFEIKEDNPNRIIIVLDPEVN